MINVTVGNGSPKIQPIRYPVILRNIHYPSLLILAVREDPKDSKKFEGIVVQESDNVQSRLNVLGEWVDLYHNVFEPADDISINIQNN